MMTKPIKPIAPIPSMLIFMDSQSSSLSGFDDSFKVFAACDSQSRIPILTAQLGFHLAIINVAVGCRFSTYRVRFLAEAKFPRFRHIRSVGASFSGKSFKPKPSKRQPGEKRGRLEDVP